MARVTIILIALYTIPGVQAEDIRQEVSGMVPKPTPPKNNVIKAEKNSLKTIKDNKDITVLPADKGNATLMLNK